MFSGAAVLFCKLHRGYCLVCFYRLCSDTPTTNRLYNWWLEAMFERCSLRESPAGRSASLACEAALVAGSSPSSRTSTPLFSVYLLLHPAPHTTRRHIYQFTSIYVLRQSYQLFLRNRVIIIHNSAQLIRERRPITTVFERTTNNHNDAQCKVPRYITKIYVKRLVWGTRGDLSAGSTSVLVDGNSTRRIWKQT